MITVTLNANGRRTTVIANEDQKLRDFIEEQGISSSVIPYLDGAALTDAQLDKSFAENDITDACIISSVVKTNNA